MIDKERKDRYSSLLKGAAILMFALLCFIIQPVSTYAGDEHDEPETVTPHPDDCGHDHEAGEPETVESEEGHEDHHVALSDHEIAEFGIRVETAGSGLLHSEISVPGVVEVNSDRVARITPRFPGIVTDVRKYVGDKVTEGEVLAVIESNEGLVPYQVKSLIDGTIIAKQIALGEIPSEDEPTYTIADLDTVWVKLNIYQRHLSQVSVGQEVVISADNGASDRRGRISYVSPVIDEHTRSASARVVLSNADGKWRPGLFVNGHVSVSSEEVEVAIPLTALQTIEGHSGVFIQTPEGFAFEEVTVGHRNSSHVEILHGLQPGELYVAEGGFTLKGELLKGDFSGECAH